jgi:hypothetical protein
MAAIVGMRTEAPPDDLATLPAHSRAMTAFALAVSVAQLSAALRARGIFQNHRATGEHVGTYRCQKMLQSGLIGELTVGVFLMKVEQKLAGWPERHERTLRWFPPLEAAALVAEPELARMIRRIPRLNQGHPRLNASPPSASPGNPCGDGETLRGFSDFGTALMADLSMRPLVQEVQHPFPASQAAGRG